MKHSDESSHSLGLAGITLSFALIAATATGCTPNYVEGTVSSKTTRVEKECVEYSKYRTNGKRKCTTYADVLHHYLTVAPDGKPGETVEVKVTSELFDGTSVGSHYSGGMK